MSAKGSSLAKEPSEHKIVHERMFDAPRELVFKAFTEPERLTRWWGPNGFTTPSCTVDLRPGGAFHYCMRSPDGKDYWGKGVYREIVRHERIEYSDTFSDENGNRALPTAYGLSRDWPEETLVKVTFEEREGATKVTLQHEVYFAPPAEVDMCRQGWAELLDRLGGYLEGAK
jgi:uncharacterized protein YndB with AHSA1/START domain